MTREERRRARGLGAWQVWIPCGLGPALLGASGNPPETPPDPLPLALFNVPIPHLFWVGGVLAHYEIEGFLRGASCG